MTVYRTGVEFGTNVGLLERDYQRAAAASGVFGEKATADLAAVTVAEDRLALAGQRVVAADTQLRASRERLNAVMASGLATQREVAAAQSAFVASQDRLIAAQSRQTALMREQETAQVAAARRPIGGGLVATAAGLAATELALKAKDAIVAGAQASAQLEAINRQVDVTLASTGNTANTSAADIDTLAESLAKTTGIMPNTIAAGQLMELTFTGIRNQGSGANAVFDRTAETAANMAIGLHLARGGAIDYQGAMRMLARALEDPVAAMGQLTRAGISFTASQKDQIKQLAENGQMLQAQQLILSLVQQKYGDAAQQFGQTSEGGFARGRVALEEFERALASPILTAGVPVLHALTGALEFLTAHEELIRIGEVGTAVIAVAFALASLQRAAAFLKESQWAAAFLRILFPLRSVQRQLGVLAVQEDTQAAAAQRAAESLNGQAAAMDRVAVSATRMGTAVKEATVASTVPPTGGTAAAARGGAGTALEEGASAGLLSRALGAVGRVAGVIALGDLVAETVGPHLHSGGVFTAFHLGQASGLLDEFNKRTIGSDMFTRANTAQQTAVERVLRQGNIINVLNEGAKGDVGPLRNMISQIDDAYMKYASDVQNTETVWGRVKLGQSEITNIYVQQKEAILDADLADAQSAQARADRMDKLARQARQLQAGVQAGRAKSVASIEQLIGVPSAGLFDQVDPNAVSAQASAATSMASAQRAATGAQRAVNLAEARLNALRQSGHATDLQLQSAENSLANARDRAAAASDRVTASEKKAHDARSSALNLDDVLKRATQQVGNDQSLAAAAQRLVQLHVSEPVMQQLLALDQEAPGTFARIAAHLTRAGADELDKDQRLKNAARHALEVAFARSNTQTAEEAARTAAHEAAKAWQEAYLAALRDPAFWQLLDTTLGRLLIGNQGVLPKNIPGASGTGTVGRGPTSIGGVLRQGLPGAGASSKQLPHGALAGPIGITSGLTSTSGTAPIVTVHVHTSTPSYSTTHHWKNDIRAADPKQFIEWADQQARVRSATP